MRILIVGASGLVGTALMKDLTKNSNNGYHVFGTYHDHPINNGYFVDITSDSQLRYMMTNLKPDVLIWLAGSKDHQNLQYDPERGQLLNVRPVKSIVEILSKQLKPCKFIYISSDYVFDGKRGDYTEYDKRAPDTVYGETKLLAENILFSSTIDYW